jgi:Putative phage metallopeptidase
MGKPKAVNFERIPADHEAYEILEDIRSEFHEELEDARIVLAWRIALKPDTDGHLVLGKCVKASDLQREFADYDFVILLNREVWESREFSDHNKRALIDHELCHAARAEEPKTEEPKVDDRGRPVWRVRKHDIEEFEAIVTRHGCYKKDLERFAEAILESRKAKGVAA